MTLYRQLLIFTLGLCFILFVGVCIDKLQSTKTFLQNQLASHAQDTATSLGLSLSPFVAKRDTATVDAMMNAIFDRGYYQSIILRDVNHQIISKRVLDVMIDEVPPWFINLISLSTPEAEALVMDGWKKAGTIYVASHPGYAYKTLWQTAVVVSIYFLLTGIVVFILGGIGLHILLRPLERVEKQAEAICRHTYEVQKRIPRTRELRQVVISMNKMTSKVKELFEEQAAIAEKLREHAFADELTGFGNRRYLAAQVSSIMQGRANVVKGAFQLIQIHDLHEINLSKGYNSGDDLIKRVAHIIYEKAIPWPEAIVTRISGSDFVLFLPNIDKEDNERIAEEIAAGLARISTEHITPTKNVCSIGGVLYYEPASLEHLLAAADAALGEAMRAGPNQYKLNVLGVSEDKPGIRGKMWWQGTLEKALAHNDIHLYAQRVARLSDITSTLHFELFSRVAIGDQNEVHAAVFIPMAERSGLITKLDRYVIETVLANMGSWGQHNLAINISVTSALDSAFVDWLRFRLANLNSARNRLVFEFPEFSAVQNLDALKTFSQLVSKTGHRIAVDQFGRSFSNFGYLRSLRPLYVKIDAAFTRELTTSINDSYFFINALKSVARSLDIKVIAEGVENQEQFNILEGLSIDGVGGYLIDQPHRFLD